MTTHPAADGRVQELSRALTAARSEFLAALAALDAAARDLPLVDSWNARDLVWHVAFWAEHGAHAAELAMAGRGAEFDYDTDRTDAMNAAEATRGRSVEMPLAREREERAHERLAAVLARLDETLLDRRLGNGDTVEEVLRYDGPDHYAEHAGHLRGA
jgi:hypothetical protein